MSSAAVDDAGEFLVALIVDDIVAQAAAVLARGVNGEMPAAEAAWVAYGLLGPAIRLICEAPVGGWPEAA